MTPEKRKEIERLVLGVMGALDATGENRAKYAASLGAMSDAQLEAWVERLREREEENFYLEVSPYKNEPTLEQIEEAAAIVGVRLHQYVYFRHDGAAADPVRTRYRVPVGFIHVRRLQQLLQKKTSYSTATDRRSQTTGQLTGDAAVGRMTNPEAYALKVIGADAVLKELLGPRADNRDKRLGMYQAIQRDGFVRLGDLRGDLKNQPTLAYLDTLLLGAGLKADIVDPGYLLRISADRPAAPR
jgi:hypothetical protein